MSLGRSKNMDEWKIKEGSFRKMKEIILWFVAITYPITLSPDYNYLLNQLEAMAYYVGVRGDIKLEKVICFILLTYFIMELIFIVVKCCIYLITLL